jgi:hypothetical protein
MQIFVSTEGNDQAPGTLEQPLASLHQAKLNIRKMKQDKRQSPIDVLIREGVYDWEEPLVFTPEDSGSAQHPISYCAYPGESVVIRGCRRLRLHWEPGQDGIWFAHVDEAEGKAGVNGLFVNGIRQICARFPKYNHENPLMGGPGYIHAAGGNDQLPDTELRFHAETFTAKRWSHPSTGIVHVFQSHYWGNMQYRIKDVDWDQKVIHLGEGGFQLQRSFGINENSRFYVENIREELDAEGEWFYAEEEGILYYYPPAGLDLQQAEFTTGHLHQLVEFRGSSAEPISNLTLEGFTFTHTRSTFMEVYEDLARGDWSIHRGGAVFMEGAIDCAVKDCLFDSIGGNGVFINHFNRRNMVTGCKFERTGESAVCLVGAREAVRMYQTWLDVASGYSPEPDQNPGPLIDDYPDSCVISNNIIRDIGIYGKQTAGVFISMSRRITVSHNTIYEVPRAAVCINDGTWGGHIIEYNDIWETVRETGEHGPFNSWGRDRQWDAESETMDKQAVFWDAMEPVAIRNNRIANYRKSVSAGNWTIDLDDGSSNYHIYNNLCLGSTLKLRDGYYRKVENNIFVSPVPIGWHVWPQESEDLFIHNIVVVSGTRPGANEPTDAIFGPIRMPEHPWGKLVNFNWYWNVNTELFLVKELPVGREYDWEAWKSLGYDLDSQCGDPLFIAPEVGDYRLASDSPVWATGFKPFAMNQFGHRQTRVEPFGGEFAQSIQVTMQADERGGEIWYTTDGSEPHPGNSTAYRYQAPLKLEETVTLKALTYKKGLAQGFTQTAVFVRVPILARPDWLHKLLSKCSLQDPEHNHEHNHDDGDGADREEAYRTSVMEHQAFLFMGAAMTDISDGDVIDALGGYDKGVLFVDVPNHSAAFKAGFRKYDIVIQWNEEGIQSLEPFIEKTQQLDREIKHVLVIRGYHTIKIVIEDVTPEVK